MSDPTTSTPVKIGILTVSDRASRGEYEDKGGPAVIEELTRILSTEWVPVSRVVPDEMDLIEYTLIELADKEHCHLIITTGGTGPAPRDVTPDATEAVCERLLPGFGELMRTVSLKKKIPTAILSRQSAAIRASSLIINLPGKPSAIYDCLMAVFPAVPDCVDLIGGPLLETNPDVIETHMPHKTSHHHK